MEMKSFRIGSDNFSYVFMDENEGLVVDPGYDPAPILKFLEDEGMDLKYILATHHHSDHTMSVFDVAARTGARIVASRYCADQMGGAELIVDDGDVLNMGSSRFEVISTPGHTPGGICLVAGNYIVTGDTLFIDDCGRCDLPEGSLKDMYESLQKLKLLDDDLLVLPGHDYGSKPSDTLGGQKRTNPTLLAKDLREFSGI